MERFRQKQRKLEELTQPGWEDAANYIWERDKKNGTSELMVPAVFQPLTDDHAVAPALNSFNELTECLDTAQYESGCMTTIMHHSLMYPTSELSAQALCAWLRYVKFILVRHGNGGEGAGWGNVNEEEQNLRNTIEMIYIP